MVYKWNKLHVAVASLQLNPINYYNSKLNILSNIGMNIFKKMIWLNKIYLKTGTKMVNWNLEEIKKTRLNFTLPILFCA